MPERELPTNEELHINAGVAAAEYFGMNIQDWTASRIAAQFHDGQASHLYSLASTGNVDTAGCFRELVQTAHEEGRTSTELNWLHALGRYVIAHDGQRPVRHWRILTADSAAPFLGRIARSVTPNR